VSPSLKLQELLRATLVRAGFAHEAKAAGLTPAAKALWIAATATHDPRRDVVVVVAPTDSDVEQLTADVRFFLGGLEGGSKAELEAAVVAFPSQEVDPFRGLAPHMSIASARARALQGLAAGHARIVVTSATGLAPRVIPPDALFDLALDLRPGADMDLERLSEILVDSGFTREDPVGDHGAFCIRGGVVDIFPAGDDLPARLEFVGDTIESIRRFDPTTQRSQDAIDHLAIVPLSDRPGRGATATLFDYLGLGRRPVFIVSEPADVHERGRAWMTQLAESYTEAVDRRARAGEEPPPEPHEILVPWTEVAARLEHAIALEELAVGESDPQSPTPNPQSPVLSQPTLSFSGRIADWIAEVRAARAHGDEVLFVAATPGRAERLLEVLDDYELRGVHSGGAGSQLSAAGLEKPGISMAHGAAVLVATGVLSRGFRLPAAGIQIYAETDLFEEERRLADQRRRHAARAFLSDLRELKVGDLVVHVDNGIGEFVGLKEMNVGPNETLEFLELRYAGDDKLFVPVSRLDLVQKYTGGARPSLDRLGGVTWEKAKTRVKKAMRDMAEELLQLYAQRKAIVGHAFPSDTHWQEEFEGAFPFDLTVDQKTAIEDIKRDMESTMPMDRLLCGDVGYGKTEVAMRAAFKAVMDGRQVAFLAPTTVLAFQHQKTLRERFSGFPVRIDLISRFRSKQEQKVTLEDLAAGRVDIIVGTHRLLSKDVVFRDLGLLVVDEEQRFGVAHKEKIKQLRKKVDVLTMTATPIPRTLNMSLVGIRDMSIIETPPKDRLAIQTNVVKFDQGVIARAVRQEMARGGQIYFVHNRVESIWSVANLLRRIVPDAKVVVGHGQMNEHELERAMLGFVNRDYDILLATTIVENGLDIPNANTLIVNRADRYGLSQLYQLRGRVGRSDRPAYAYLLIPPERALSAVARKRLAAIKEFSDLGSGFRVAALDLEIRGAGNLLGGQQSGHIEAVGFEMYMKLLEEAVSELKGEVVEDDARATVNLGIDIRIDEHYIPDMAQRLVVYRKVASARDEKEIDDAIAEARDRYGALPESMLNLEAYGRICMYATRLGIESIDRKGGHVVVKFRENAPSRVPDPAHIMRIAQKRGDTQLVPPSSLRLDLAWRPASAGRETGARDSRGARLPSTPLRTGQPDQQSRQFAEGRRPRAAGRTSSAPSWWTARATEAEVRGGFTKEEILKPAKEDPRAEGGVFERVGGLLAQLLPH
jgi:transcription-repair coupling factor (superfamily II helicase)